MHPRLKYYPFYDDYVNQRIEFRPYVMFLNEPHYRSNSVNIDRFGLRVQYDFHDNFIDLYKLKENYEYCNVMVGNSTVFGASVSSDKHTIPHLLNQPDLPCLNWGLRGSTSQQEYILYTSLKYLLPKVKNLIIFTGINTCSLASFFGSVIYPEIGAVFSQERAFRAFNENYLEKKSEEDWQKVRFLKYMEEKYDQKKWVRKFAKFVSDKTLNPDIPVDTMSFEERLSVALAANINDIESWSYIEHATETKVHYIVQPVINWTTKPLTQLERACFEADCEALESLKLYTNTATHKKFVDKISDACRRFRIDFHDANLWLNDVKYEKETMFTDVCHFNDNGSKIMASLLKEKLQWKE